MTREELRDYVDEQRILDNIPYYVYSALIDGIDTLEEEPETGHWVEDEYEMEVRCSACGEENDECSNYCPNCGCRMVEPQERSDKE